jgi:hypothetical protein
MWDNIIETNLEGKVCTGRGWILLVQLCVQWRALVNTVMNINMGIS